LDMVITDHHVPLGPIPPALAVLDPKMPGSPYPFQELAGVGVAFKLLQALFASTGRGGEWEKYLDLVALGTVADMVPLTGENRYLVKRGLEVLNQSCRVGLREMINCAGLQPGKIDAERIAYALAPRLNASGRLDHAVVSYELLMAESKEQARELALALEANNTERQRLTAETFADAKQKVLIEGADQPLLMVSDYDCPPGVVGVVAGRLVDEFYRPSIVVSVDGDTARGSARSIRGFNIFDALCECRELFTRFGGHAQAAGFQAPIANLEKVRLKLLDIASRELSEADLRPTLMIDVEIPLSKVSGEVYVLTSRLAPFGQSNQAPVFLSRNVKVVSARTVGGNGDHLKMTLHDGRAVWDAIAFDHGKSELSSHIDVVYNLEVEGWSGRELLRLNVLDFRPAS
jgi:single-stranded-DNA-specific exonuclease